MSFAKSHNVGGVVAVVRASDNVAVVAAGAGDNVQVVGQILDRSLFANPLSAVFAILYKLVQAGATNFTLAYQIEHGDDPALGDAAVLTGPGGVTFSQVATLQETGAGTKRGQKEIDVDLAGAKRYLRLKYTPDLTAGGVDTVELASLAVFGGADTLPL